MSKGPKPRKFLSSYKSLAKEFHPTKNGPLTADSIGYGSRLVVWWRCPSGHDWQSAVHRRTLQGQSCFVCRSLGFLFPEIASEWSTEHNEGISTLEVSFSSNKEYFWNCKKCSLLYRSSPNRRTGQKSGCPFCSGRLASPKNNLLVTHKELAKEWDHSRNGGKSPTDVTSGSSRSFYWLCKEGHSFKATVNNRTAHKSRCPYCVGRKATDSRNLAALFPELALEWHPQRNGSDTPSMFTPGSGRKAWWVCRNGHDFQSVISARTHRGSGCPKCSNQSSKQEMRILTELMGLFPDAISRAKCEGYELDIFIPSINVGIEYDGAYWHESKKELDERKRKAFLMSTLKLIRVREKPLEKEGDYDLLVKPGDLEKSDLNSLVDMIKLVTKAKRSSLDQYIKQKTFINDEVYREYLSYFPNPLPDRSLSVKEPEIALEWNFERNGALTPRNFSVGSKTKVWWRCPKGHDYEASVLSRTSMRSGCPFCNSKRAYTGNSLEGRFPDLADEFAIDKNDGLKPSQITYGSKRKVWWRCKNQHLFQATVNSRTSQGSRCTQCLMLGLIPKVKV